MHYKTGEWYRLRDDVIGEAKFILVLGRKECDYRKSFLGCSNKRCKGLLEVVGSSEPICGYSFGATTYKLVKKQCITK
jgi:hypothetical protein